MKPSYRDRIYRTYATQFQREGTAAQADVSERWGDAYRHYLEDLLPANKDARIADVACGDGRLLALLGKLGYANIEGVDVSPEQVQLARAVTQNVTEADAVSFLRTRQDQYDRILAIDVIEHLEKEEVLAFLDACSHALRPNGMLIVQTPNGDSMWAGVNRYGDFTHEGCFTPKSLAHVLRVSGLEPIEARELGPIARGYSIASSVRYAAWQMIRAGLLVWNLVETGHPGSRILTRVFMMAAVKAL